MKNLICLLLFMFLFTAVKAQSLTESQDWKDLINSLQNENWVDANRLSFKCLNEVPADEKEGNMGSLLRYMVIYSESGLMNMGSVTQKQALNKVAQFAGHTITLPAHPITLKFGFNSIELVDDKTDTLTICASNQKATDIHCFEYIILKDKWPIDDFKKNNGNMFRLSGTLKTITVEGHMLPRFHLTIDNGERESFDK